MADELQLPENILHSTKELLATNAAERMWLQMGMGLLLKAFSAYLMDCYLTNTAVDPTKWACEIDEKIPTMTNEDMAKILLGWHHSMKSYAETRGTKP